MRKRWILGLLFLSAFLPVFMHLWTRDKYAVIYPFPFYHSPEGPLAIHPQTWANLWLQRLRMFPLLFILYKLTPPLRGVWLCYMILEGLSVADWFLRYGQDILAPGFDFNIIVIAGLFASITCFIIHFLHAQQK